MRRGSPIATRNQLKRPAHEHIRWRRFSREFGCKLGCQLAVLQAFNVELDNVGLLEFGNGGFEQVAIGVVRQKYPGFRGGHLRLPNAVQPEPERLLISCCLLEMDGTEGCHVIITPERPAIKKDNFIV